ncbi:MAG: restriction endonuclease subunit S [Sediminibacterium sp.]|nr:restriction endonuclease subunit S [Sediminibacterium sp.]MDP3128912.1 restriction endonuclease subunit S [Sediminibacterium sp.]
MKNWEKKKLGDVCTLINRGVSPKYLEKGGLLVLNQKCIRDHCINIEPARYHDSKLKPVSSERLIQIGDVVVNSTGTGTLGRVAQVKKLIQATVDSHVTIVRPIKDLFFSEFFGYAMINIEEEITEGGEGCGGQTELSRNKLKENYYISFPKSISEQQRIVSILDEAFTAIATAKANVEQNLKNARELFESYLQGVFENKGEGWDDKTLNEISEKLDSKRIPITKNVRKEGSIPYYGASGIVDYVADYLFDEDLLCVSEDGANLLARTYPIAFSISGKTWVNNHAHILRFNNIVSQKFVELYLNSIKLDDFVSGMAQPKLNQTMLNKIPIPFPKSLMEQESIVLKLEALSTETKKLESNFQQKIEDLEELKKSVLQKAFNGELKTK